MNINIKHISLNSKRLYEKREHILLGISPFNSYFSEHRILNMLSWSMNKFSKVNIFVPDQLPIYNFLALGYQKDKAIKKARRQANYLKNKIYRGSAQLGFSNDETNRIIITMEVLQENAAYINLLNQCKSLYLSNSKFKHACINFTKLILQPYDIKPEMIINFDVAVNYVLEELPLLINTSGILNTKSSIFAYSEIPDFINDLFKNEYGIVALNQGFLQYQF